MTQIQQRKNRKRSKKLIVLIFAALILLLFVYLLINRILFKSEVNIEQESISEQKLSLPSPSKIPSSKSEKTAIPESLNLNVPFVSQAPKENWDKTHEDLCEEATVLMSKLYFEGNYLESKDDQEVELKKIVNFEMNEFGFFESTTAVQTSIIAEKMFGLKTQLIEDPSIDQMKELLSSGKLILVPAAGRTLKNPFYKSPGPLYHFILIKGYTSDKFITNDPGTKRGENFPYDYQAILNSNHDWNSGEVEKGKKTIIVLSKT